ncbi:MULTISPECIES: HAD family phosphatase [unclassified Leeuwenhoekiella]|uniref:HAD family hydrolase n=1 Tax=unclassified Leeuwenhoekiella TaxID=2615029 RepID=UPI000C4A2EBA|nr:MULTISPECIES: HAD family phosphatase [unclassified Leeuwenhoekiella]MAW94628.1 haloacid dehalogenase [Leeuwenhoekiella sp.]MBA82051.1 haloacid dehalogenase [Leeuwenhoekiella sp.]|tara:strand:+ start:13026 stop:13640 length:615 start_codon:yes stop_codon:yes gene_type:complete
MIKNLLFDFGDVFINLDKKAPELALNKLGVREISEEMTNWHNSYEKGIISTDQIIKNYLNSFPQLSALSFKNAWNSIILDFPQHRLDWIVRLHKEKKYRLFLLSNTNELHIEQVIKNMGAIRYSKFQSCFERFYLSHQINMRKPDLDIYDFVMQNDNLQPKETLFIDDTLLNTAAAASMGIYTWHLEPASDDVTQVFNLKKELF